MQQMLCTNNKCSINFRTTREIPVCFSSDEQVTFSAKNQNEENRWRRSWAFKKVIEYFEENDEEQRTMMDLANKMAEIF